MKLFLLDAYALIYRGYYGFIKNPRINSKGENVSAIYGFINTLDEVLAKEQPTHIPTAAPSATRPTRPIKRSARRRRRPSASACPSSRSC